MGRQGRTGSGVKQPHVDPLAQLRAGQGPRRTSASRPDGEDEGVVAVRARVSWSDRSGLEQAGSRAMRARPRPSSDRGRVAQPAVSPDRRLQKKVASRSAGTGGPHGRTPIFSMRRDRPAAGRGVEGVPGPGRGPRAPQASGGARRRGGAIRTRARGVEDEVEDRGAEARASVRRPASRRDHLAAFSLEGDAAARQADEAPRTGRPWTPRPGAGASIG